MTNGSMAPPRKKAKTSHYKALKEAERKAIDELDEAAKQYVSIFRAARKAELTSKFWLDALRTVRQRSSTSCRFRLPRNAV